MKSALEAFSAEVVRACASKYGFDGEEALRSLEIGMKVKTKKIAGGGKSAKTTRATPSIPLPFNGTVREDCCIGVKQNHGLYTQCFSAPGETGLCKGCSKQASKNASGEPDCGVIAKRVIQGDEYRDAKGRAPVHFTKVMKKQKLTEEQVQAEATKFGIVLDASHFAAPQAQQKRGRPKKATTSDTESENSSASGEKKSRGRPKKAAKVVEVNETEDLFASLMQQAQSASPRASSSEAKEAVSDVSSDSESDSEPKPLKKKTKKQKEESEEELAEKAAKFLAKEAEKEKKVAEKEAEKQKKVAEKEAEKQKKVAEKEAEKAKAQAKAGGGKAGGGKAGGGKKKAEEPVAAVEADLESEAETEEDEPVVTVKKFEHEGVKYLKSSDGVLYDAKSQEVVGKWNETTKSIEVYDGESESEDEESDDEDD
jgi:hypothetical protein